MSTDFHKTMIGRKFYDRDVPAIVKALQGIDRSLKEISALLALADTRPALVKKILKEVRKAAK